MFLNKKTPVLIVIFLILLVFVSCKMSQPKIDEDYKGLTDLEKNMQFEYDMCVYAQQYSENVDLRCYDILARNSKIKTILRYKQLEKEKKIPLIYRSSGSEPMTFDDFFKFVN